MKTKLIPKFQNPSGPLTEDDFSQRIEDIKYPNGYYLHEQVVTPSRTYTGTLPQEAMWEQFQQSQRNAQRKDARDNYTIQHNMSQTGSNIAKGVFEAASIPASFNPVVGGVLGATYGAAAAKDIADNGLNWGNGLQLGLSALPLGRSAYKGFRYAWDALPKRANFVGYGINPADTPLGNRFAIDSGLYPDFSKMTRAEKIQYLKTQQELAQRVDQTRTMDALRMTKDRLRNGGFDRLEKTIEDDYTGKSQEILGLAAGQDKNAKIVQDLIKNQRKTILNSKPTKGTAQEVTKIANYPLDAHDAGTGVLGGLYSWFKDAPRNLQSLQKANKGLAHEFAHYVYMPFSFPKGFNPKATNSVEIAKYFTGGTRFPNTGEIAARGTQLKNYFGLKEGEQLTKDMWDYAARHYAADVADNNMTQFFLSGSNKYPYHPLFLQWLNKHAPVVGTGITVTGGIPKTTNSNE